VIYIITNRIAGKSYVGITKNMRKRWIQHCSHARRTNGPNFKLYEAMRQFGLENFSMVEINRASSLDEAKNLETSYIQLFDTMNPEHGYNGNSGGQGHEISEETRRKLSEANSGEKNPHFGKKGPLSPSFGLKRTAETRQLQSQRKKDLIAAGWKPKPLPAESRERIRLASVGLKRSKESRRKMSESAKRRGTAHLHTPEVTAKRTRQDITLDMILPLVSAGISIRQVALRLGVSHTLVLARLKQQKVAA
jgi:group I intron endonuclease